MRRSPDPICFTFPVDQCHGGVPLGNGLFGVLLWSDGKETHLTVNRQDVWMHPTTLRLLPECTYSEVLALHETGDPAKLIAHDDPDLPPPARWAMGRFSMQKAIDAANLDLATGVVGSGDLRAVIARGGALLALKGLPGRLEPRPAQGDDLDEYRSQAGVESASVFRDGNVVGWTETLAGNGAYACACLQERDRAWIVALRGDSEEELRAACFQTLIVAPPYEEIECESRLFYADWWGRSPWLATGEPCVDRLYWLGMWKLSGMTAVGSPAPTLQGPWVEDDRIPPWGCDYHFNVNVQMCHWPMLGGNHLELFEPLVRTLDQWRPRMLEDGRTFYGLDGAMFLSHATDDRGTLRSVHWTHQLDPASLPWTAIDLFEAHRYGAPREWLSDVTYPLLRGSLLGYLAVLDEGGIPAAPSPEIWVPGVSSWQRNPSFQLAIVHRLMWAVREAARELKIDEPDLDAWTERVSRVPLASVVDGEVGIWDGQVLHESHRHHSHLAGLHPFQTFEGDEPEFQKAVRRWVAMGTGRWSGWAQTWASILCSRLGWPEAAMHHLTVFDRFFARPNGATRHDAWSSGVTLLDGAPDIMQIDGAMGAAAAAMEALVHDHRGEVRFGRGIPARVEAAFEGIRLPGGSLASGEFDGTSWKTRVERAPV